MQGFTRATAVAGFSFTVVAAGVMAPMAAHASPVGDVAHGHVAKPVAGVAFTSSVVDPSKNRTVEGIDLTDKGTVLVSEGASSNAPAGYAVIKAGKRTVLKSTDPNGKTYWIGPTRVSDSGWIGGLAQSSDYPYYVAADWRSASSPVTPTCVPSSPQNCVTGMAAKTIVDGSEINAAGEMVSYTINSIAGPRSYRIDPVTGLSSQISLPDVGESVQAEAISDKGDVAGTAYQPNGGPMQFRYRPFVQSKAGATAWLPVPSGVPGAWATRMSSSGNFIAGYFQTADGQYSPNEGSLLLWNSARTVTLITGLPTGFGVSAVNDSGWIVGSANNVAYLVRNGKAIPLASLTSLPQGTPAGTTICWADDINKSGQILASTCDAKGAPSRALLLTPKK